MVESAPSDEDCQARPERVMAYFTHYQWIQIYEFLVNFVRLCNLFAIDLRIV